MPHHILLQGFVFLQLGKFFLHNTSITRSYSNLQEQGFTVFTASSGFSELHHVLYCTAAAALSIISSTFVMYVAPLKRNSHLL